MKKSLAIIFGILLFVSGTLQVNAAQDCEAKFTPKTMAAYIQCLFNKSESDIVAAVKSFKDGQAEQRKQITFAHLQKVQQEEVYLSDVQFQSERERAELQRRIDYLKFTGSSKDAYARETELLKSLKKLEDAMKKVSTIRIDILKAEKKREELLLDLATAEQALRLRRDGMSRNISEYTSPTIGQ